MFADLRHDILILLRTSNRFAVDFRDHIIRLQQTLGGNVRGDISDHKASNAFQSQFIT